MLVICGLIEARTVSTMSTFPAVVTVDIYCGSVPNHNLLYTCAPVTRLVISLSNINKESFFSLFMSGQLSDKCNNLVGMGWSGFFE